MTHLLEEVFDQLQTLPPDMQDCVAQLVRDALADEAQWQRLFDSTKSEDWLSQKIVFLRT